MSQDFTDNCFEGGHVVQTDMQNVENNFAAIKSGFSGSSAPSNTVGGMRWFDIDVDQLYIRNAANNQWLTVDFIPGTIMLFGQASAPLGWTKLVSWSDNSMLCINTQADGTTLGYGGSANPQSGHTHAYTETTGHVHQWYNYSAPSLNDTSYNSSGSSIGITVGERFSLYSANHIMTHDGLSKNNGLISSYYTAKGYSSGTTNNNTTPLYQEIIACTKD